ncbi:MAG: hypothetical protein AAFY25_01860, partial [Pseudomonadota bacterium]
VPLMGVQAQAALDGNYTGAQVLTALGDLVDAAKLGYTVEVRQDLCRGIDFDGSLAAAKEAMDAAGVRLT